MTAPDAYDVDNSGDYDDDLVITREEHESRRRMERKLRRAKKHRASQGKSPDRTIEMSPLGISKATNDSLIINTMEQKRRIQESMLRARERARDASGESHSTGIGPSASFFLVGLGSGCFMTTALLVETEWFRESQPEGPGITSGITMAALLAPPSLLPLYIIFRDIYPDLLNYNRAVSALTITSAILALVAGLTWPFTVGGSSVFIFAISFMASGIGQLQTMVVLPWSLKSYNPRLVSVILTGSNFGNLLGALLGLLQDPGGRKRFDPTVYFLIIFVILVVPAFAFRQILKQGLGLRPDMLGSVRRVEEEGMDSKQRLARSMSLERQGVEGESIWRRDPVAGDILERGSGAPSTSSRSNVGPVTMAESEISFISYIYAICSPPEGWRKVTLHAFLNALIQLLSLNMLNLMTPYAAYHTKHHHSSSSGDIRGSILDHVVVLSYAALTLGCTHASCIKSHLTIKITSTI